MNVKIWDGTKQDSQLKTPILKMVKDGDNIDINCVDEDSYVIAYLLTITKRGVNLNPSAKRILEKEGYDTSFTSWDETGDIKVID